MEEARVYQVYGVMDLVLQVIIVPKEQLNQFHVQLDNGVMGIQRFVSLFFHLFYFVYFFFLRENLCFQLYIDLCNVKLT